ncbi:MAG: hypothetical protein ACQR33_01535 [Candidatus Saccharibacteria bacterium]
MSAQPAHECPYGDIAAHYYPETGETVIHLSVKSRLHFASLSIPDVRRCNTDVSVNTPLPGLAVWMTKAGRLNVLALNAEGKIALETLVDRRYDLRSMEDLAREGRHLGIGNGTFSLCYISDHVPQLYVAVANIIQCGRAKQEYTVLTHDASALI